MSKAPKSTSTSYSGSSNPAFQPAALAGVNSVNQIYDANKAGLQGLSDNLNQTIIPGLQSQANQAGGAAGQGLGYYSDVLGGKYLNSGNPYLKNIMDQTNENIFNTVGSHFSATGRYGSGANQAVLGKQIANADNQLQYQNYSDQLGRMDQAAQGSQGANTASTAALLQALTQGAQLPYTGSESLANSLGALFSGGSDKSKSTGANPIWGAIGQGLGAAASIAAGSDRRLKTNIVRIGEWDDKGDGLGKYEWNWRADPDGPKVVGVIADEVKELRPQAYVPNFRGDGFDGVNYAMLGAA